MIPMRHSSIFKSRWMALIWAAGIIWSAVEFAGDSSQGDNGDAAVTDVTGAPIDADQMKKTEQILKTFGG